MPFVGGCNGGGEIVACNGLKMACLSRPLSSGFDDGEQLPYLCKVDDAVLINRVERVASDGVVCHVMLDDAFYQDSVFVHDDEIAAVDMQF